MVYLSSEVTYTRYNKGLCDHNDNNLELRMLSVSKGMSKPIMIMNIYRPDKDGDLPTAIRLLKEKIQALDRNKYAEIILLGDFNVNYRVNNPKKDKLVRMANGLGFTQLITNITRYNLNGEHTTIDLIFTNSTHITQSGTCSTGVSDHEMIYVSRSHISLPKIPIKFTGRSYMRYIKDNFITGLRNTDWTAFWDTTDPEQAWAILQNQMSFLLDITCPVKSFICKKTKEP